MKRFLISVIVVLVALFLFLGMALAQNQKMRVRVVAEQANIRVSPDITSEMLFQVPEGTELEAEKKVGEWYLILYDRADGSKGQGYVHESLVEVIQVEKPGVQTLPQPLKEETRKSEKPVPSGNREVPRPSSRPSGITAPTIKMKNFSFDIFTGGFYLKAAEINGTAAGIINYYKFYLGNDARERLRPLHFGLNFGAELSYRVGSGLYFALGFEYLTRETADKLEYGVGSDLPYSVVVTRGIKDLPLRISVGFEPNENFYIKVGIEYHLAGFRYFYSAPLSLNQPASDQAAWQGKASGQSLGWMEALGYRYQIASWLRIFVEGSYRYARIKNFEGTNDYRNTLGDSRQDKGRLYQWDVMVDTGKTFPVLFVRESPPTEPGVFNVRTADLNFSGFAIRLGFHLRF